MILTDCMSDAKLTLVGTGEGSQDVLLRVFILGRGRKVVVVA